MRGSGMRAGKRLIGLLIMIMMIIAALSVQKPVRYAEAAAPEVKSFQLYATDGNMTLPDGMSIYIWGYSLKNEPGSAVFTSPTLQVNEGDTVQVTLTNIGAKKQGIKRVAHTIHFHGLDTNQQNDGVPHTSEAIQEGGSFTYTFTATHAGTYFYHCHVDTIEHLQMGMYGALIVKAKGGTNQAWTGGPAYDKDYVLLLNEIDPVWHKAVEEGKSYDRTDFHPAYWTMNGKAYPDTEEDPSTMIEGKVGETVLIRIINAGYQPHSFHMHGFHFQVIASDGRPLPEPLTKDTILIGSGERYDILVTFDQSGMFPLHSHNIVDNTNNGAYPGGLHTMIDVKENADSSSSMGVTLTMKAGDPEITVNGAKITLSKPPINQKGTTYVPLRFIGEQLGAKVEWLQKEQSVLYTTGKKKIQLWVNGKQALVGAKLLPLQLPPMTVDGLVMVPLRFVVDQMGAKVDYSPATGLIIVKGEMSMPADSESSGGHSGHDDRVSGSSGSEGSSNTTGNEPGTEEPGTDVPAAVNDVTITKSAFVPNKLTIKKGQTVTWTNADSQIHTVYDLNDAFTSRNLLYQDRFQFQFLVPGTYTYYCSTHPSMQGEITVTE